LTIGFFPPVPVYPTGIDDDYTLYLVHNTTETILTSNNPAWSEEIAIKAQPAGALEIWSDNGFATIEGELLYYDSVDKDSNGMVCKLKRCLRNIGGKQTQFNPAGTWIRSFVIAEHHTQLVAAILDVEDFIGENFSPDEATLDWRIRHLNAEPIIFDDICPDVGFTFNVISSDPSTGSVASYSVQSQGTTGSVQIQFGDGTSTTVLSGTHTYAPNATIDPVLVVSNGKCQIVQTPIENTTTPGVAQLPTINPPAPPFTVPIPIPPQIPPFVFPSLFIPSLTIDFPPIIMPHIDLGPIVIPSAISIFIPSVSLPSVISITPVNIPSVIQFQPSDPLPSVISFDNVPSSFPLVQFGPAPSIIIATFATPPSFDVVQFGAPPSFQCVKFCSPPSFAPIGFTDAPSFVIATFGPAPSFQCIKFCSAPSFGPIEFGAAPSFAQIQFGPAPLLSVVWGTPPAIGCSCTITCPTSTPASMAMAGFGLDADPNFGGELEVQYDVVDFPSEIKIVPPNIPPLEVKHDIPSTIRLEMPELKDIRLIGTDIPSEIRIIPPDINTMISVISFELPKEAFKVQIDASSLPTVIGLEFPETMPDIKIDASSIPEFIKVVGMPDVITVMHTIPSVITVDVPKDLKVPLVFEGPPLSAEVKINWGFEKVLEGVESPRCFALVPCGKT
jgi:PKD repeat protein